MAITQDDAAFWNGSSLRVLDSATTTTTINKNKTDDQRFYAFFFHFTFQLYWITVWWHLHTAIILGDKSKTAKRKKSIYIFMPL